MKLAACTGSQRKAVDSDDSEAEVEVNSGAEEGWTPSGPKSGKGASLEEPDDLSDVSEEEVEDAGGTFRLGEQDERFQDFSKSLKIKDDAANRSLIVYLPIQNKFPIPNKITFCTLAQRDVTYNTYVVRCGLFLVAGWNLRNVYDCFLI